MCSFLLGGIKKDGFIKGMVFLQFLRVRMGLVIIRVQPEEGESALLLTFLWL